MGKVTGSTLSCTTAVSKIGLPRGHSLGFYHGSHITPSKDPIRYVAPEFVVPCTSILFCPCCVACAVCVHLSLLQVRHCILRNVWGDFLPLNYPFPPPVLRLQPSSLISIYCTLVLLASLEDAVHARPSLNVSKWPTLS